MARRSGALCGKPREDPTQFPDLLEQLAVKEEFLVTGA
jgi:hypothetical protein